MERPAQECEALLGRNNAAGSDAQVRSGYRTEDPNDASVEVAPAVGNERPLRDNIGTGGPNGERTGRRDGEDRAYLYHCWRGPRGRQVV